MLEKGLLPTSNAIWCFALWWRLTYCSPRTAVLFSFSYLLKSMGECGLYLFSYDYKNVTTSRQYPKTTVALLLTDIDLQLHYSYFLSCPQVFWKPKTSGTDAPSSTSSRQTPAVMRTVSTSTSGYLRDAKVAYSMLNLMERLIFNTTHTKEANT